MYMRLAFVFPPSMPPTAPPCGIAYLKAFLGQGTLFDLNLSYHDASVHAMNECSLPVEAELRGYVLEPEQLKEAAIFLKDGKEFFNPEEYNVNVSIFINYMKKVDSYLTEQSMRYVFEDSIDDEAQTFFDHLLSPVREYHPDLVGFSQMILSQREFILGLAKMLKTEDIPVVVGGASLSYNPGAYLSEIGTKKIDLSHFFDAVFYGEGELSLKAYIEGEDLEKIPNIVYKKETIIKNEESGLSDIDVLPPPDFDGFPLKEYYSPKVILPLLTSRGCYWMRCTFCIHHRSYYRYRVRSTEKVIQDLKELQKRYNAFYFNLIDEMIHPRRFDQLSERILQEKLNIRFYADARPTKDFTPSLLRKMYTAGVRAVLWGVESGTQRILDVIDKGTTIPDIEAVLQTSHEAGIWNMIFVIMGYPTVTEDDVKNDITFFTKNEQYISTLARSLFHLEVGSRIYENPEKFCITKIEENPDPFSAICRYEVSEGLLNREAERIYRKHRKEMMSISKVSPYFGRLRDHMLLFADHLSLNPLTDT